MHLIILASNKELNVEHLCLVNTCRYVHYNKGHQAGAQNAEGEKKHHGFFWVKNAHGFFREKKSHGFFRPTQSYLWKIFQVNLK